MKYRNEECAICALKDTCPEAKVVPEEKKPAPAIQELTEVNEAVDEMIDSLFVVLDRINNAQAFLESPEGANFALAPINGKACFAPQLASGSPDAHFAAKFVRKA